MELKLTNLVQPIFLHKEFQVRYQSHHIVEVVSQLPFAYSPFVASQKLSSL